ncbi:MAG TPA: hypothetical protein VFX15_03180 [Actinomycetes bacterium]|nr:hypothetical protein [Actinomycetes bacterium]
MSDWPTADNPGIATIRRTSVGTTFGIYWSNFPAMERRGGYSGPYSTREEATQGARDWADHWEAPVTIVQEGDDV